jgi:hypothetical protein
MRGEMGRSMSTRKAALGAAILVPLAACGGGGGTGAGGNLGAGVVSVQSSASGSGRVGSPKPIA